MFTGAYTEYPFYQSTLVCSAVAYQMIVLGEAVKRLNPGIRERHMNIPWKDMTGMRDILSHQYDKIDLEEIWDTVQRDVPRLAADLREIRSALRR